MEWNSMTAAHNKSQYRIKKLNHRLYQLTLPIPFLVGDVNTYVLLGDEVTLIDTGVHTDQAWCLLEKGFKDIGLELKDITQLFLTHHHLDHIGQANLIKQLTGCRIIAHPDAEPFMRQEQTFITGIRNQKRSFYLAHGIPEADLQQYLKISPTTLSVKPDQLLTEGDVLPGHPEWQVIETPGHAIGHISLYHEQEQVLIAGDHLIKHISANAILEYVEQAGVFQRVRSLITYRQALQKCLKLQIRTAYSGHGEPITEVNELIKRQLAKQDARAQKIFELTSSGQRTTYEIIQAMFPHKYKTQFSLVFSEVIGHLDLLEEQGRIEAKLEYGKQFYYAKYNA